MEQYINPDAEVSHHVFPANSLWPNNNHLPVLVYKNVFNNDSTKATVDLSNILKTTIGVIHGKIVCFNTTITIVTRMRY